MTTQRTDNFVIGMLSTSADAAVPTAVILLEIFQRWSSAVSASSIPREDNFVQRVFLGILWRKATMHRPLRPGRYGALP
jgi:hypothetical protein